MGAISTRTNLWTQQEAFQVIEYFLDGRELPWIARQINRPESSVKRELGQRNLPMETIKRYREEKRSALVVLKLHPKVPHTKKQKAAGKE